MFAWIKRIFSEWSSDAKQLLGAPGSVVSEAWTFRPCPGDPHRTCSLPVAIHPCESKHILLAMPGWDGHIDGYAQKYAKLASFIVEKDVAAVVRSGNHPVSGVDFEISCVEQLRAMADHALANASRICGNNAPSLLLMGFSAGASAIAAIASSTPEVEGILLLAPSADAGAAAVQASMEAFTGNAHVIVGDQDQVVGDFPRQVASWSPPGARRELVLLPKCDHQFRGANNGRIMSQAPLWAFSELDPFPHPTAGRLLYE